MSPRDRPLNLVPASVMDYREAARRKLPRQIFDYIDGGAYAETTMQQNVAALQQLHFRQRVLCDVSAVDPSVRLFDENLAFPVILGPVGMAGTFARRGEVLAARAAEEAGIRFCESTVSICSIEEVRAATTAPLWFQLYVMRDRGYAEQLMQRAKASGCSVLVLTVDLAVVGARYRDTRNGVAGQLHGWRQLGRAWDLLTHPRWVADVGLFGKPLTFGNLADAVPGARRPADFRDWVASQFDPAVTWDDLAWVREHWDGPLILKGILDPEDAKRAAVAGADGLVISNHGGRQLDDVRATATAVPAITDAVGDDLTVLVDGGIRSGLDVVKMLCLGADACLLGRAWAWAVAGGGQAGVAHILRIIEDEIKVAMALTGTTHIADLGTDTLDAVTRR